MKLRWQIILIMSLALFFLSCSSSETIIKDKKIEITVPAISETLPAVYKEIPKPIADSLNKIFSALPDTARVEAEKQITIKSKSKTINTKVNIKYYPKKKIFELDIPEYKVDSTITDTTTVTIKKETTLAEKFGYATIGIIIFLFLLAIIFLWVKR